MNDPGRNLEDAARILWRHKSLPLMGIGIVILTASGLLGRVFFETITQIILPAFSEQLPDLPLPEPAPLVSLGQIGALYRLIDSGGTGGWVAAIGGFLFVLIALAVVAVWLEAAMIAATAESAAGRPVSIRAALGAGWRSLGAMVVIASVPAIPITFASIVIVALVTGEAVAAGGVEGLSANPDALNTLIVTSSGATAVAWCLTGTVGLFLQLLAVLAYRACILERLPAFAALRRAWIVLRGNFGGVLLLIVISLGIYLATGMVAALPDQLAAIFLPVLPVVWVMDGIVRAYFIVLWTLAWLGWAGGVQSPKA